MFQVQNQVSLRNAKPMLIDYFKAGLVPFLRSSPALGKSSLIHQIAAEFDIFVIDLRLSQCDPTDLNGFPDIDKVNNIARYIPMETFPIRGQTLPTNEVTGQPYKGWMLFLDEFNSAPSSVQAAAYKLVLDRKVGQYTLHDKVLIACAGNLDTDGAITNPLSSAMVSRVSHIHIRPDLDCFLEHAEKNKWSPFITSFLQYRPDAFYTFDVANPDQVYAAPRPWEGINKLITKAWNGEIPKGKTTTIAGTVGEAVALEMDMFIEFHHLMPDLNEIIKRPLEAEVPKEQGIRFALAGALAEKATTDNFGDIAKYVNRLPPEIQVVCFRSAIRRSKELRSHEAVYQWATANSDIFF